MNKRLLIVTDAWYPQVNGVVTVLASMQKHLEQNGYDVHILHPGRFFSVPLPGYPEIRLALFSLRAVSRTITQEWDHVHIATEGPLGLFARRACLLRGMHFSTSYHTHFHLYVSARLGGLLRPVTAYMRWFHAQAERTLVATASLRDTLASLGFAHLSVWPLGVDTEMFHPRKRREDIGKRRPIFAYVGRLAVEKGVDDFCALDLPGTKVVVGDGPERKRLEKQYSGVEFLGYMHGEQLAELFASADVLVFPSRTETFGLVVLESLASGTPVAAYNVMGPRDIIQNGRTGILSLDLRAAALACLLLDRAGCRAAAERYSWDASAEVFRSLLVKTDGTRRRSIR